MAVGEGCWQKSRFSIATAMIATCHKRWQRPPEPNGWMLPSKNGQQCHCSLAKKKWHHHSIKKGCCQQHPVFPGGHPSKYWLGSTLLNFSDRTRTGVFNVIWPLVKDAGKICVFPSLMIKYYTVLKPLMVAAKIAVFHIFCKKDESKWNDEKEKNNNNPLMVWWCSFLGHLSGLPWVCIV